MRPSPRILMCPPHYYGIEYEINPWTSRSQCSAPAGAGDALCCGDTLFAGYRIRADAGGHQWLSAQIAKRVLPLELINPRFYHLDTCFCPLSPGVAIWFPEAFDAYGRKVIEANVP